MTPPTVSAATEALPLSTDWQVLHGSHSALGESPLWLEDAGHLVWVDIPQRRVLRTALQGGAPEVWALPSEPGCLAPDTNGGWVLALRDGLYTASTWGGALQPLAVLPYDPATVRANDGKCDALGRLWVGTIDEPKTRRAAALYCVDALQPGAPRISQHASDALTGNGLAWSPDGRTLYWSDTPNHVVYAWDFDAEGPRLSAHREHLRFAAKPTDWRWDDAPSRYAGRPDGACVDQQGNYWVALYEGARVCQFAPDGRLLRSLAVPALCPTMPCLGGPDGRTLFVTTARKGRSDAELAALPDSGAVFCTQVDVPGLPVQRWRSA